VHFLFFELFLFTFFLFFILLFLELHDLVPLVLREVTRERFSIIELSSGSLVSELETQVSKVLRVGRRSVTRFAQIGPAFWVHERVLGLVYTRTRIQASCDVKGRILLLDCCSRSSYCIQKLMLLSFLRLILPLV
jgi:hypothetical protein